MQTSLIFKSLLHLIDFLDKITVLVSPKSAGGVAPGAGPALGRLGAPGLVPAPGRGGLGGLGEVLMVVLPINN